jgi:hypothetical protein
VIYRGAQAWGSPERSCGILFTQSVATPATGRANVVLSEGILDVCQQFGSTADQECSTTQQISRATHLLRIDVRQRKVPAVQQLGDLPRVDLVILGLG